MGPRQIRHRIRSGGSAPSVRVLSNLDDSRHHYRSHREPAVGITIDDVPFGTSTSNGGGSGQLVPDIDPADLIRVEVLRGLQGTLYGASSMGGLLKFVTIDPTTDALSGRVEADLNSVHSGGDLGGVQLSSRALTACLTESRDTFPTTVSGPHESAPSRSSCADTPPRPSPGERSRSWGARSTPS